MSMNEQAVKKKKRKYTLPFTILGLVWGTMSVIFAFTEIGKEQPTAWYMYVIFLPAYLNFQLMLLIDFLSGNKFLSWIALNLEAYFLYIFISILPIAPIGALLGWLLGKIIDATNLKLNPVKKDDL